MATVDNDIEVSIPYKKNKTVPAKLGTVLTESEYQSLKAMITSSDKENHTIAQHILNQCDIQKSIYWIWRLAKHNAYNMVYLRTKASREFRDATSLFDIAYMKPQEFGLHLDKKGWLTEEIYQRLKPGMLEQLAQHNLGQRFFQIHTIVKDKYRLLDPDCQLTHLPVKETYHE
jgi:hypothetical protein